MLSFSLQVQVVGFNTSFIHPQVMVEVPRFGAYLTPLILLGYALAFAKADASRDLDFFDANLADKCVAYGCHNKVGVKIEKENHFFPASKARDKKTSYTDWIGSDWISPSLGPD